MRVCKGKEEPGVCEGTQQKAAGNTENQLAPSGSGKESVRVRCPGWTGISASLTNLGSRLTSNRAGVLSSQERGAVQAIGTDLVPLGY